jgi:hypothetical protein
MKKLLLKPGFEFIFSFSFIMILGLPPVLLAQIKTQKDLDIRIENGDTTINGKNLKELSAADRQDALKDIQNLRSSTANNDDEHTLVFRKKRRDVGGQPEITQNAIIRDSLGNVVESRSGKTGGMNKRMSFNYRFNNDEAPGRMNGDRFAGRGQGRAMRGYQRRNTQNFDYENINNDGVITHVSLHLSEASDDDLKRMPYVEGPKFEIKDLNLVPQFSTGKILLMFNLLSKAPAEVKLSDSEGKLLWSEKAVNGSFNKSFALGLNGIYYLQIQQGKSISLKKIMKEE